MACKEATCLRDARCPDPLKQICWAIIILKNGFLRHHPQDKLFLEKSKDVKSEGSFVTFKTLNETRIGLEPYSLKTMQDNMFPGKLTKGFSYF